MVPATRWFLRACVASWVLATSIVAAAPPNVLFIAVDDLRPELGCYGAAHIHSPNIDRLAASGTTFLRAYCQQAVCSPSRSSLLTGLRPDSTKVYDLVTHFRTAVPDVVTLGQHFKQNGYYAVSMGKIYHGGYDDPPSWSEPARKPSGGQAYVTEANRKLINEKRSRSSRPRLAQKAAGRQSRGTPTERADVPDNAYTDGAVAELGVATMRELHAKGQPFFLAVGFLKPHLPFNSPEKYWKLYDPAKIELAKNPQPPQGVTPYSLTDFGELRNYHGVPTSGPISDEDARQLKHGYYAAVSFTDANVGKLLDELTRLGLDENTIVVLVGRSRLEARRARRMVQAHEFRERRQRDPHHAGAGTKGGRREDPRASRVRRYLPDALRPGRPAEAVAFGRHERRAALGRARPRLEARRVQPVSARLRDGLLDEDRPLPVCQLERQGHGPSGSGRTLRPRSRSGRE